MTTEEIWDSILLGLADNFEAGNRGLRTFSPSSPEEFEPLRECLAMKIAEGSLMDVQSMKVYRLTSAGYEKYKPRIDALRMLGG